MKLEEKYLGESIYNKIKNAKTLMELINIFDNNYNNIKKFERKKFINALQNKSFELGYKKGLRDKNV